MDNSVGLVRSARKALKSRQGFTSLVMYLAAGSLSLAANLISACFPAGSPPGSMNCTQCFGSPHVQTGVLTLLKTALTVPLRGIKSGRKLDAVGCTLSGHYYGTQTFYTFPTITEVLMLCPKYTFWHLYLTLKVIVHMSAVKELLNAANCFLFPWVNCGTGLLPGLVGFFTFVL